MQIAVKYRLFEPSKGTKISSEIRVVRGMGVKLRTCFFFSKKKCLLNFCFYSTLTEENEQVQ